MNRESNAFDLEEYLAKGVEKTVRGIIKSAVFSPKEAAYTAKFALAAKEANAKRQKLLQSGTHVPPFLIASITTRCNLNCKGCYARSLNDADKEPCDQMTQDEWDRVFSEASDIGICFIILAGGEPLVRKDVLQKAASHKKITFPVITNGTMLRGEYLDIFDINRNLIPVLSIEGNESTTDARRGDGVYAKLTETMKRLDEARMTFAVSITVTKENISEVTGEQFARDIYSKGCKGVIYIEYVPVTEESVGIAPQEAEREMLSERITALRQEFDDMLFIAFPGDELKAGGCLAAGRGFFHINSHGGAEPCPFSPYSTVNLKTSSLLDAIESDLFTSLRSGNILSGSHKGGCVLYEKREQVEKLIENNNK